MEEDKANDLIQIKPTHLFRYASEWDPREPGHTKGGYLEGKLNLPKNCGNLKVVLSTVANTPLSLDPELEKLYPQLKEIHPALLYVVRKGKGNRRMNDREPVPNHHHWRQEFHIIDRCVRIKNRISNADIKRYDKIEPLPDMDDIFMMGSDMVLNIGKGSNELNLIILIPKTEARSFEDEVTINKIVADRISNPEAAESVLMNYTKKTSTNIKKLKIKVEIFSLETNRLICSAYSVAISDNASKEHGAMDFQVVNPLRSCAKGGRKIYMLSENQLAKDVEPRFLLYDGNGKHLLEMEHFVVQPADVTVLKETIIFISPPQPHIEMIMRNGWSIKLVGVRKSDGFQSTRKFPFNYVPEDFYDPCIFCNFNSDGYSSEVGLPEPIGPARPGVKKRKMAESESTVPKKVSSMFRFGKKDRPAEQVAGASAEKWPTLSKLLIPPTTATTAPTANKPEPARPVTEGKLKLKPLALLQEAKTPSSPQPPPNAVPLVIPEIPPLISNKALPSMPDLIDLSKSDTQKKEDPKEKSANSKIQDDSLKASFKRLVNMMMTQTEPFSKREKPITPTPSYKRKLGNGSPLPSLPPPVPNKPVVENTVKNLYMYDQILEVEEPQPFLHHKSNQLKSPRIVREQRSPRPLVPNEQKSPRPLGINQQNRTVQQPKAPKPLVVIHEPDLIDQKSPRPLVIDEKKPMEQIISKPLVIKLESEDEDMIEVDPTLEIKKERNNGMLLSPSCATKELNNKQTTNKVQKILPRKTIEAYIKRLETVQEENFFANFPGEMPFCPLTELSGEKMYTSRLREDYKSELNNLDNLDILDKLYHPLPQNLNECLQTNYNYASIGKKTL